MAVFSFLTDLLAIGIVLSTLVAMNVLTQYELSHGFLNLVQVWSKLPLERTDGLIETFPPVSRCLVRGFTSRNAKDQNDVLCNLPQNDLFEKAFVLNFAFLLLVLGLCGISWIYTTISFVFRVINR